MDQVSFYSPVYIETLPTESYLSLKNLVNFAEFVFNFDGAYRIKSDQFETENLTKEKVFVQPFEATSLPPLNHLQCISLVAIAILFPVGICLFAIKLWHHWDGYRVASKEIEETDCSSCDSTSEIKGDFTEEKLRSFSTDSTSEQKKPVVEKLVETTTVDQTNLAETKREPENLVPFSFVIDNDSSEANIKKTSETKILHLNEQQQQFLSNQSINLNILDLYNLDPNIKNSITTKLNRTDKSPFRDLLNPQTDHLRKEFKDPDFSELGEGLNLLLKMENFKF